MKKLLLVAFVVAATSSVTSAQMKKNAQMAKSENKKMMPMKNMDMMNMSPTAKGTWLLGPAILLNSSSSDDGTTKVKQTNMAFQPELGYFIADDISVGLTFDFGTMQSKADGTATDKNSEFFVAPTLRYYMPISPKFQFLGKLQIPVGQYKTTLEGGVETDSKVSIFGVQASPCFAFFPSNKISIEMGLGSVFFSSRKQGDLTTNEFGLAFLGDNNFEYSIGGPTLGVKWHFGK